MKFENIEHFSPFARPGRQRVEKMYRVPQPGPERADERNHMGYWADDAPLDDLVLAQRAYEAYLVRPLQLTSQHRLLKVGCGWGASTLDLAAQFGGQVHGIDLVESHIQVARRQAERRGLEDRARFAVADVAALPFEAGSFDVIIAQEVLIHLPDRNRVAAELARCLRLGGMLVLSDQILSPNVGRLGRYAVFHSSGTPFIGTLVDYQQVFDADFKLVASEDVTERTLARFFDWAQADRYRCMKALVHNQHGKLSLIHI